LEGNLAQPRSPRRKGEGLMVSIGYMPFPPMNNMICCVSGEVISEDEEEEGEDDNIMEYMNEQRSKQEKEKEAILNDQTMIAEVHIFLVSLRLIPNCQTGQYEPI
jgi:hypothetical protein